MTENDATTKADDAAQSIEKLELEDCLDIRSAIDFHEKAQKLSNAKNITIDFSKLESITTPGFQTILSLAKTIEKNGGEISLQNMSDDTIERLTDLGLILQFNNWKAENV